MQPTDTETASPARKTSPNPPAPTDGGPIGDVITRSPEEAAVVAATETSDLTEQQVQSATEWFMNEKQEQPTLLTFDVNVAAVGLPDKWIRWTIRALQRHEVKEIRAAASDPNTGVEDDMDINLGVMIRASVDPDFTSEAVRGQYADPADLVNRRFAHKPGIIEAIARKANEMSGYAGKSIIRPVDAAGN